LFRRHVAVQFENEMNTLSNSVRLTGFLGAAPDITITENNKKVARISLATNLQFRNSKNELVKQTDWHQLVLWEGQAEIAEKYFKKGKEIAVAGRLANRYYTDKDGVKRFITEVIVNEVLLLGNRQN